jgi:hypothetical protein
MRQKGQQDSQHGRDNTVPHGRWGIFLIARGKISEQATHETQNDYNYRNFYDFFRLQRMSIPDAYACAAKLLLHVIHVLRWAHKETAPSSIPNTQLRNTNKTYTNQEQNPREKEIESLLNYFPSLVIMFLLEWKSLMSPSRDEVKNNAGCPVG